MSGDTSPLGAHWARYAIPATETLPRIDYAPIAAQLAEELDYVAAGRLDGRLVLCRYTHRQILGITCSWGLLSDRARQLDAIRRGVG